LILTLLFIATTVNYADRATLSIAGTQMQSHLGVSVVTMGYLFSAFGWSYVAAQIPGGWLLDRYGSRRVYLLSILVWSVLGVAQGVVGFLRPVGLVAMLFILRLGVGMAEAPVFPGNSRIVAGLVPYGRAGDGGGGVQLGAIFRAGRVFSSAGLDHASVRVAVRVLFHGHGRAGSAVFLAP
jgi:MFS transporter, ACS family, glucarate transporter